MSGLCSLPLKLAQMADPPKEVNATTLSAEHVLRLVFSSGQYHYADSLIHALSPCFLWDGETSTKYLFIALQQLAGAKGIKPITLTSLEKCFKLSLAS